MKSTPPFFVARNWLIVAGVAALAGSAAAPPVPHPAAFEVNQQVKRVYALPEFLPENTADPLRWIWLKIERFFHWLTTIYDTQPLLYWTLLVVCLTLLALLLTHITWTVRRLLFVGATEGGDLKEGGHRERLSATYREEALRRAALGDFTEAIRHLFLSLVYHYDESGRVSFKRAYTNREYLGLFAERPQVHSELKVFVDALDQHWYGVRPANQERYDECLALYQSLT
jgi:hypothetical protein